jgi:hypothetical protein
MAVETVPNMGVLTSPHGRPGGGNGMEGDVRTERCADGTKQTPRVICRFYPKILPRCMGLMGTTSETAPE